MSPFVFLLCAVFVVVAGVIQLIDCLVNKAGGKSYLTPVSLIAIGVCMAFEHFPK